MRSASALLRVTVAAPMSGALGELATLPTARPYESLCPHNFEPRPPANSEKGESPI